MAFNVDPEKDTPEYYYRKGLMFIEENEPEEANKMWKISATKNHAPSINNLALLNGGGVTSPYNIDYAAECFYKTATLNHKDAKQTIHMLEAADRGGFGFDNLARTAGPAQTFMGGSKQISLNSLHTVCACRFVKVLCDIFNAAETVIAYELDCAAASDEEYVHNFIERTGIKKETYSGGEHRLESESPADKITDGLNQLAVSMSQKGASPEIITFQRCTIVGYLILHSHWGYHSTQLHGINRFFDSDENGSDELIRFF